VDQGPGVQGCEERASGWGPPFSRSPASHRALDRLRREARRTAKQEAAIAFLELYDCRVGLFRVEFVGGAIQDVEADDFDDDGTTITLFCYRPAGADPIAPHTRKETVATFLRSDLVGPPLQVAR
jgi:hypothetical protein